MHARSSPDIPWLELKDVSCERGGRTLFRQVQMAVHAGQWLYVTGPNGVGKTSLLRMICGLAPIDSGAVHWHGQPIAQQRARYGRDLCYLGHLNGLQEAMTVDENLSFVGALRGAITSAQRRQHVLTQFGLKGRSQQLVRHLSQGQKRRVALARLALSHARLWVLDEPYVALDDKGIAFLADCIAQHLAGGGLAVLTSHQAVPVGDVPPLLLPLGTA